MASNRHVVPDFCKARAWSEDACRSMVVARVGLENEKSHMKKSRLKGTHSRCFLGTYETFRPTFQKMPLLEQIHPIWFVQKARAM